MREIFLKTYIPNRARSLLMYLQDKHKNLGTYKIAPPGKFLKAYFLIRELIIEKLEFGEVLICVSLEEAGIQPS